MESWKIYLLTSNLESLYNIRFYYFPIPKKLSHFLPAYSDIRKFVIIPIPTNPAF